MATNKSTGEGKEGKIQCLACGDYFWYIHPNHFKTHDDDLPSSYEQYKQWIAEKHGLSEDCELLTDDTVISPNPWKEVKDEWDVPIGFKPR